MENVKSKIQGISALDRCLYIHGSTLLSYSGGRHQADDSFSHIEFKVLFSSSGVEHETKEFMEYFEESVKAVQYRMKKLNISLGGDFKMFSSGTRTGITVGNSSSSQSSTKECENVLTTIF